MWAGTEVLTLGRPVRRDPEGQKLGTEVSKEARGPRRGQGRGDGPGERGGRTRPRQLRSLLEGRTLAELPPLSTWQRGSDASRLLGQVWWYLLGANFVSREYKARLCSLPHSYGL